MNTSREKVRFFPARGTQSMRQPIRVTWDWRKIKSQHLVKIKCTCFVTRLGECICATSCGILSAEKVTSKALGFYIQQTGSKNSQLLSLKTEEGITISPFHLFLG